MLRTLLLISALEFALQQPASDLQLPKEPYVGRRSGFGDATFTLSLAMMMPDAGDQRPAFGAVVDLLRVDEVEISPRR